MALTPDSQTARPYVCTHTALLSFPEMPLAARQDHVFPALKYKALLSIGQLCDHVFKAIFDDTMVYLANADTTITGTLNISNGPYFIDLQLPSVPVPHPLNLHVSNAHAMITKADLVQYLHHAAFRPVVYTWTQAIDSSFFAT